MLLGPGRCCWMLLKSDAIYVFYRGISNIPRLSRNRLCSGSRDAGVQSPQQQKSCCYSEGLCEGPQCVSWTCGCLLCFLTKQEIVRPNNKVQVEATFWELQSDRPTATCGMLLEGAAVSAWVRGTNNGVTAELPLRCLLPQL